MTGGQPRCDLFIVLGSLVAEGCPQLALQLARHWKAQGLVVELLCLSPEADDLRPEFEALAIPIHTISLGSGLARYPRLTWLSFRLCRWRRPQAVLSFPLGWHSLLALGARAAGVRHVCAHVGNLPPVWTGRAFGKFKALVQLGRPVTNRLLCCSDYIRTATLRDFGLHPQETATVYNACDLDRFATQVRAPSPPGPPRIGMVARLELHKDQPTLIRAAALLRDQGVPCNVWLVGEGSNRPQLEALIEELDLADQVQLLGMHRDIPELLGQLDLFAFAAKPDEGFGIALAEAMAAGVPIVATDVGACREVLENGRCGLLVEPSSPQALAAGIGTVLADPAAAARRAATARERALRDFSVEAMALAYGRELGLSVA
ncbi:glycosyltransferase [Synechococcus sp. Tobar12-5m-g]|uniref:glycosyltransferase n=1 Tax=unclassified Synechococcus TaxID=2626047 RepID=UPI0020CE85DB|nr:MULTISPECIES: glycosyltransferase [unclassified Synechococcus]MCP9773909.1 glycosyltransferase [Synechococcus sp. Tobar12-5m-g]MCP9874881.1 glycosyltransferase [Synechococcus sp. Cruz CV-v-12]